MKQLGIIGCGWLGSRIASLLENQYTISVVNRTEKEFAFLHNKPKQYIADFDQEKDMVANTDLLAMDAILISVTGSKRTDVAALQHRFRQIGNYIQGFQGLVFLCSSTGIYPENKEIIQENSFADELLDAALLAIEKEVRSYFPTGTILRLAGLLGDERKLSKYPVKDLEVAVNHIHYVDIAAILDQMITANIQDEIFNVVAPEHPLKGEIIAYQKGENWQNNLVESPQRIVSSEKLQRKLGYSFEKPNSMYF